MASPMRAMMLGSRALRCLRVIGLQRSYVTASDRRGGNPIPRPCTGVTSSRLQASHSARAATPGSHSRRDDGGGERGLLQGASISDVKFKLDEKTAHSSLDLIKKDTGIIYRMLGIDPSKIPQNPERFREWAVVLGDTSMSNGRYYWEVTVKKSNEFRIGVTDADMSRDECIGVNNRSWVFAYSHKKWHGMVANKTIPITNIGHPSKVGLLLDYDNGKLSLVDSEKGSLIHTLNAEFRGPLLPAFGLWDGELLTHSGLDVPDNL